MRASGNRVERWRAQSARVACSPLPALGEEATEGQPGDRAVAAAVDEIHRHVEGPLDVGPVDVVAGERERQEPGARVVGVAPDMGAVALEPRRLAIDDRRRRVQRGEDRGHAQQRAQLGRGVGLVGPVDVGLDRGRAQHHVEAAAADRRHVRAHDVVALLGHPRDVGPGAERPEPDRQPGQSEGPTDRREIGAVGLEISRQLGAVDHRPRRQLELTAGLDRDLIGAAHQGDHVAALLDRRPAAGGEAVEHRADARRGRRTPGRCRRRRRWREPRSARARSRPSRPRGGFSAPRK
jgi:hypothetical protein